MTPTPTATEHLRTADLGAFFRPRDAEAAGITYRQLRNMEARGLLERVGRGLYRQTGADITENHGIAWVCARVPDAVVCLLTALAVHDIGTQVPHQVWIAIPHKARAPAAGDLPLRVTRFSGPSLFYGVTDTRFEGVSARITSPARTVVDCFRFRRKVGLDVALEALEDVLRKRKATPDELWRAADVCRAKSLVGPALTVWAS